MQCFLNSPPFLRSMSMGPATPETAHDCLSCAIFARQRWPLNPNQSQKEERIFPGGVSDAPGTLPDQASCVLNPTTRSNNLLLVGESLKDLSVSISLLHSLCLSLSLSLNLSLNSPLSCAA